MPEASDIGYDNDSDEEDQYGGTDDLVIGDHYKKPFFTNAEKKSYPNGCIAVNDLQQNENLFGCYKHPHWNTNKDRIGVKLLIPLAHR